MGTLTLPAVWTGSFAPDPTASSSPQNSYTGQFSFAVFDNAAITGYYLAYARVLDANGQPWGRDNQNNCDHDD